MGVKGFFQRVYSTARYLATGEARAADFYPIINSVLSRFTVWLGGDSDCAVKGGKGAMQISTVFTCVLVRAETLSTIPFSVLQSTDQGSRTAYEHPAHELIHNRPNPFQTAADFWKTVSAHIDLHGNCFAIVTYSGRWEPKRLDIVCDPSAVQILESESGEAYYEYNGKKYASYEMLHFKDLSLDGYYGCSKIEYNRSTLAYAKKLRNYGNNAVDNRPPGYFTTEQNYNTVKGQEKQLIESWKQNTSEGKTPLLPFGLKYVTFQVNPNDAQYLESIDATKEDIYGIMRTPPTLAQNYERATFANAEQQDLVFVKYTMTPVVNNIEQECNSKLFSESNKRSRTPYYVKGNVNALLRGDFRTRTEGYRQLWQIGAINGDKIAELEDWNKWDGGSERFVPMNMVPLSRLDDYLDNITEPVETNAPDPGGDPNQARSNEGFIFRRNGHKKNGAHHEN